MSTPIQQYFTSGPYVGRKVYYKIRLNDGAILHRNSPWPNSVDDEEIVGDVSGNKFIPYQVEPSDPIIDSNLFSEVTTEDITATAAILRKSTVRRSKEEIKNRIKNLERLARASLAPAEDFSSVVIILLSALARKTKNLVLTTEEQAAMDQIVALATKVRANKVKAAALEAKVDADQDPDLSTPWESSP